VPLLKWFWIMFLVVHDKGGVPQGGVISPVAVNIAVDGLQTLIGPKIGFIRYADDFICTARTKEQIEAIKPIIERWLAEKGLMLNHEKT